MVGVRLLLRTEPNNAEQRFRQNLFVSSGSMRRWNNIRRGDWSSGNLQRDAVDDEEPELLALDDDVTIAEGVVSVLAFLA